MKYRIHRNPEWNTPAIIRRFFDGYNKRFRSVWKGSAVERQTIKVDIKRLIRREGAERTCKAIDTIFSDRLRWVTGGHLQALMRENFFRDYVVPAMDIPEIKAGEQSEWFKRKIDAAFSRMKLG